ncbi:MAG: hypothetical protein U0992_23025 [Planctomycetaceae bacterium]
MALKVLKKRLKLTQLDSDSKLGVGPLSAAKGLTPRCAAQSAHPTAVWQELVRQGKLKSRRTRPVLAGPDVIPGLLRRSRCLLAA